MLSPGRGSSADGRACPVACHDAFPLASVLAYKRSLVAQQYVFLCRHHRPLSAAYGAKRNHCDFAALSDPELDEGARADATEH